jgi:hypothetical protein
MSDTSTKDPAPLHTTRQLLDELDALMERMLALPVEDGSPAGAASATPTVGATLTMLDPPDVTQNEYDGSSPDGSAPIDSAATRTETDADDLADSLQRPDFGPPALEAERMEDADAAPRVYATAPTFHDELDAAPSYTTPCVYAEPAARSVVEVIVPAPQPLAPLPPRLRPSRRVGYQFLLWVNRGYDHGTFLLGPRGGWLRSTMFRWFLGAAGAGLLTAALAWLVWDWFDWTR